MTTQQMQPAGGSGISTALLCGAGALVGMTSLLMLQKSEKMKAKEAKYEILKERKRKYYERKVIEQMVKEMEEGRKLKRRVHLYFDENDEMVERDDEEGLEISMMKQSLQSECLDVDELKKKLKGVQNKQRFNTKITVNLGDEEYDQGKSKITQDIFDGNNKTQNAELFIENLQRTKNRHQNEMIKQKSSKNVQNNQGQQQKQNDTDSNELDKKQLKAQHEAEKVEDEVIMDLNLKEFEKKDHVFMDFLTLYGKNFIETKKEEDIINQRNRQYSQRSNFKTPNQYSQKGGAGVTYYQPAQKSKGYQKSERFDTAQSCRSGEHGIYTPYAQLYQQLNEKEQKQQ